MNKQRKSRVPIGAKIISVLYYIGAISAVILGIVFFLGAFIIGDLIRQVLFLAIFSSSLFIIFGIIFLVIGIIGFFVGWGLWKGKQWARIIAIVIAVLGIITAIFGMNRGKDFSGNVISLIVDLIIGSYLLFSKKVKAAFR